MDYTDIYDRFTRQLIDRLATDADYIESISTGNLNLQYRYKILASDSGSDFISSGASSNDVGTIFYATSESVIWGSTGELQRGFKPYEIVNNNITTAETHLTSYASAIGASYSTTDTIDEATKLYVLFLLYSNNQKEEGGADEFNNCVNLLAAVWGNGIRDIMIPENAVASDNTKIIYEVDCDVTVPKWKDDDIDADYIQQIQTQ